MLWKCDFRRKSGGRGLYFFNVCYENLTDSYCFFPSSLAQPLIVCKITKKTRVPSEQLKAFVTVADLNDLESTINQNKNSILNKNSMLPGFKEKVTALQKANSARLHFVKDHMNEPEACWKFISQRDDTKIELLGLNENHYVWRDENTAFLHERVISSVKNGVGSNKMFFLFCSFYLLFETAL